MVPAWLGVPSAAAVGPELEPELGLELIITGPTLQGPVTTRLGLNSAAIWMKIHLSACPYTDPVKLGTRVRPRHDTAFAGLLRRNHFRPSKPAFKVPCYQEIPHSGHHDKGIHAPGDITDHIATGLPFDEYRFGQVIRRLLTLLTNFIICPSAQVAEVGKLVMATIVDEQVYLQRPNSLISRSLIFRTFLTVILLIPPLFRISSNHRSL